MSLQSFAFKALVDTGSDAELEVMRRDGDNRIIVGAGIFCLSFPAAETHLVAGAIARVLDETTTRRGEICVLQLDEGQVEVGFGLSNDGHSVWINCAPFHLRLPVYAANYLIGTLSEARRQWQEEKTVVGATLAQRLAS